MKRDTIFALASMTKPVTAAALMMLVEEGKIRLDDPVDKYLPELSHRQVLNRPDSPLSDTHPATRPITLRDILRYRMGIGWPLPNLISPDAPISKAFASLGDLDSDGLGTANEYMKRLGALPLIYDPGDQFMYQTPAVVLGVLIERLSGEPMAKFMEERLFRPLGMKDTGFWVPAEKRPRLATIYQSGKGPGNLVPVERIFTQPPGFPNGGNGLVSTIDDFLNFARMMLQGGQVDGVRVLSRKSIELMTQDQMSPAQHEMRWAGMDWWSAHGFGFALQIQTKQTGLGPSIGSYNWDGATAVHWTVDPKEDLILIRMDQRWGLIPGGDFDKDFDNAVYQALAD